MLKSSPKFPKRTLVVELDCSLYLYVFAFLVTRVNRLLKPVCYFVALYTAFLTRNLMFPFIFGLLISELSTNNVFAWIRAKFWLNRITQTLLALCILGIVFLPQTVIALQEWYLSYAHIPASSVFNNRTIQGREEHGGDFCLLLLACALLVLVELSPTLQTCLSHRGFRILGRYSFGAYCLHAFVSVSPGVYLYHTLSAALVHVEHDKRLIVSCLTYMLLVLYLLPVCILFERTADAGGMWAGRFANGMTDRFINALYDSWLADRVRFHVRDFIMPFLTKKYLK